MRPRLLQIAPYFSRIDARRPHCLFHSSALSFDVFPDDKWLHFGSKDSPQEPPKVDPLSFDFPPVPVTWFIGHMNRALREMHDMVKTQQVDLIIETRDARLPITSINMEFERLLQSGGSSWTKRVIVYNKSDLVDPQTRDRLRTAIEKSSGDSVVFTTFRSHEDVKALLRHAIKIADRPMVDEEDRINFMVTGMPNVGKSSLLNALRHVGVRKGKAASTSSVAGHTRRLSNTVKINEEPPVYIYDTPGIMVPFFGRGDMGKEAALKLAATSGLKENLIPRDIVAHYLLWKLRLRCLDANDPITEDQVMERLDLPTKTRLDNAAEFFKSLADRLHARKKGGGLNEEHAYEWFVFAFREGRLGYWTLDDLGDNLDSTIEQYIRDINERSKRKEKTHEKELKKRAKMIKKKTYTSPKGFPTRK